jgi:SAM-dependent methyltransferase
VSSSFRDPDGFVFRIDGRILRCVFPHAVENLRTFLASAVAKEWQDEGVLASARPLTSEDAAALPAEAVDRAHDGSIWLEHAPIRFPNYPCEWPPEMLRAAGQVTLRLARQALKAGFTLKDATPYNVMFDGPRPVFIDLLSFDGRDPLESIWPAYAQFVRTFVYPLVAVKYGGARIDEILLVHRDGIEPDRVAQMLGIRRWLPPFLSTIALPALLSRRAEEGSAVPSRKAKDASEATFILETRFEKTLRKLPAIPASTGASAYMETNCIYSSSEWAAKETAIAKTLERLRPESVLDVGCNTGHFSKLAARSSAAVVAIDHDPAAVGALWTSASAGGLAILPLVVDIARPTAALGWANTECPSFLDRARGRFDCVLMLALTHHLVVNERVPLDRIFELAAQLTRGLLVIEYVDPSDPQFRRIARGRDALHRDLTQSSFESAARRRFQVADSIAVTRTRVIYTLEQKGN